MGIAAGLVVLLYRVLLEYAGRGMELVLEYARRYPVLAESCSSYCLPLPALWESW